MQIEKISYSIDWGEMRVGQSFFVPCINHRVARKAIRAIADRLKMELVIKIVIEEGVKGLRVWKVSA